MKNATKTLPEPANNEPHQLRVAVDVAAPQYKLIAMNDIPGASPEDTFKRGQELDLYGYSLTEVKGQFIPKWLTKGTMPTCFRSAETDEIYGNEVILTPFLPPTCSEIDMAEYNPGDFRAIMYAAEYPMGKVIQFTPAVDTGKPTFTPTECKVIEHYATKELRMNPEPDPKTKQFSLYIIDKTA